MDDHYKRARFIATLLDAQFSIGGVRFGLDPILSIVPWVGSAGGLLLSLYILIIAREAKVSFFDFARMIGNIVIDFIVGFIPFIGVIFDVAYKANIRNLKILEKYIYIYRPEGKVIEGNIV